jgi:hypothetical protein
MKDWEKLIDDMVRDKKLANRLKELFNAEAEHTAYLIDICKK